MTTKLLWHSNSPWSPTGYGQQTGLFAPRLAAHYDMRISAFYGLEGASLKFGGVPVLPGLGNTFGNEAIPAHAERWFKDARDGLLMTLMDVWVLDAKLCAEFNTISWAPVDHEPAPPRVLAYFRESQAVPLAMTRFGQEQLKELSPLYCPHGVDTSVFRPMDRKEARAEFEMDPDAFIVGQVGANKGNPSRKSFPIVVEAFAEFRRRHENAILFLHTDIEGKWAAGVNLKPLIEHLGIPKEAVVHVDPYVTQFQPMSADAMATLYSAMDVLVNPSTGEGFGIPILEAQACGVPVIVTEFSAMPEVCGAGWTVSGAKRWSVQESWQMVPFADDLLEAMEAAYQLSDAARKDLSTRARGHAMQYDVDVVMGEYMLPALEAAQERFAMRKPVFVPGKSASQNGHVQIGDVELQIEDHPTGGMKDVVGVEIEAFNLADIPVEPGDVIVDVGAHVGVVSIYLARKHPEATILAFEPLPENFERLQRNLEANEITNVAAFPLAVTVDGRDLELVTDPATNSGAASAFVKHGGGDRVSVKSTTLERILDEHDIDRIRLLKIDCEGAEYEILANGVLDKVDYLTGEFHWNEALKQAGHDPNVEITRLVEALGEDHVRAMVSPIEE